MATKTQAPAKATTDGEVDADGFAIIDPTAAKVAYDAKAPRPFKLHCDGCGKAIMRADRAPGHRCFKCVSASKAKAPQVVAQPTEANAVEPVKAAPKPRRNSQNPRVLANRMVTARAKAIADRSTADA